MNNQPEDINAVMFRTGGSLRFENDQITLDPVKIKDLTLKDFKKIHSFFRRVEQQKSNNPRPRRYSLETQQ